MEGFLGAGMSLQPWKRRLVTRLVAIVPAVVVAVSFGDAGLNNLLILSQVILSVALPFALWPLLYFTSHPKFMSIQHEHIPYTSPDRTTIPDSPLSPLTVLSVDPSLAEQGSRDPSLLTSHSSDDPMLNSNPGVQISLVSYANSWPVMIIGVLLALLLTGLNILLIIQSLLP